MQFTKLRIQGFKTFVDPSDFAIKQGLTGVVGPNGCGKSNLVEALRWVMGENSYKNMRASGMDDVIFSGNNTRPSRNHAEVILTIDNAKRLAPALFNDSDILEISRKIEREAGSTYKINGKEVRARDVQLLFADASSGSRSPSMVRQGQIGEIINAKPQARRRILEEAAGISGLYARRHEAEMRLKAAEGNLEKLEFIFDGMKSQVENLKRQAKGAVKYRVLSEEIRKAEALVAYARFMDVLSAVITAEKQVESERLNVASVTIKQAETAKNQAISQERLPNLRESAAKAGSALARLINARDMLEQEEKRARTRSAELTKLIEQADKDIAREKALFNDTDTVLKRLVSEKTTLLTEQSLLNAKENDLKEALKTAENAVTTADIAFNAATTALAENTARKNAIEREAREALERLKRVEIQMNQIDSEINQHSLLNKDEAKLQTLKDAYEAAFKAQELAEGEVLASENALKQARLSFEETRKPLQDVERKALNLETEVKTLTKLLLPPSNQKSTPIIDNIIVNKGYERALAAALQDDLDVTLDEAMAFHWKNIQPLEDDAKFPETIEPLYNRVKAPKALMRRLKQIGIVAKSEGATAQKLLKAGQRLVSIEGDLWRWDGLTMSSSAQSPAARRLAEKNRLTDLNEEALKAKATLTTHKALFEVAQATLKTLSDSETKLRDKWRQAGRLVEFARSEVTALERSMAQMLTRKASLAESKARLTTSLNDYKEANDKAVLAQANAPILAPLEATLQATRQEVQILRAKANEIRVASDSLKRDHENRDRRLNSIETEQLTWAKRIDSANEQITSLQQRKDHAVLELNQLESAPDYFLEKRRSLIDGIREAEQNRKDTADALSIGERMSFEADKAASEALKAFSSVRENFVRAESVLEQVKLRKTDVETQIYEAFEAAPQALPDIAKFDRHDKSPDMKQVEAELETKKRERERLGGVNLQADSELETSEKELDRLIKERDDLIEAIKKLRTAINSLNREGRERLLASFDTVNSNFKRIFVTLFGGGTADLQLIESDDPLEAGLDILAMPPGKKPQTMTLLSGGEQALTAIALIFAVFLTNPAPICVLDEVDAPLDDSNVERYCDLLVEMAKATSTRFMVITHNPITMARMNRLFGVTMAERGVSQLVSVDLEKAELLIAA